jgi:hypothetical protein
MQRTITLVQSVSAVRTLLHGAMGTITYLRYVSDPALSCIYSYPRRGSNLLPTDNFNQSAYMRLARP